MTRSAAGPGADHRDADREHPNQREAEHRIRTACQVALSTAGTSSTAPKMTKVAAASNAPVSSMRYETLPPSRLRTAEEGSAHERCDEARAPDRLRETERERSPGERNDLKPGWCDGCSPDSDDHDSGSDRAAPAPASAP